jgi:hypothetical protein
MGQGASTALAQIAADGLGLELKQVEFRTGTQCPELALSVTAWTQMGFPELRVDRPYNQPGDDGRP